MDPEPEVVRSIEDAAHGSLATNDPLAFLKSLREWKGPYLSYKGSEFKPNGFQCIDWGQTNPRMPPSDISDEEALRLFQEDMRHCIRERKRQADSKVYTDRDSAFVKTTWNLMKSGSEDYWWDLINRSTSRRVQILAGRGQLDLAAIQAIPAGTEQDLGG